MIYPITKVVLCEKCNRTYKYSIRDKILQNCGEQDIYTQIGASQGPDLYGEIGDDSGMENLHISSPPVVPVKPTPAPPVPNKKPPPIPARPPLPNTRPPVPSRPNKITPKITSFDIRDFDLINKLGEGAYGIVLGATHIPTKKYIALKVINKKKILDHGLPQDLFNEETGLKICTQGFNQKLTENVCTFIGCWQDSNRCYFAMEHLPNNTLGHYCVESPDTQGPQTLNFVMYYGTEIARGLKYLNSQGLLHRDLKHDNVAIDIKGHARLIDFGLSFPHAKIKGAFSFVGTANFLAPEILTASSKDLTSCYNSEVDWWALGVMLYEMRTFKMLFSGKTEDDVFESIMKKDISLITLQRKLGSRDGLLADVLAGETGLLVRQKENRLAARCHSENIHRSRHNHYRDPLEHPFFKQGAELIRTQKPLMKLTYVVDADEDRQENDNLYRSRSIMTKTRYGNKKNLLPRCHDRISAKDANLFNGFGCVVNL